MTLRENLQPAQLSARMGLLACCRSKMTEREHWWEVPWTPSSYDGGRGTPAGEAPLEYTKSRWATILHLTFLANAFEKAR